MNAELWKEDSITEEMEAEVLKCYKHYQVDEICLDLYTLSHDIRIRKLRSRKLISNELMKIANNAECLYDEESLINKYILDPFLFVKKSKVDKIRKIPFIGKVIIKRLGLK